jgi:hypothetical protein
MCGWHVTGTPNRSGTVAKPARRPAPRVRVHRQPRLAKEHHRRLPPAPDSCTNSCRRSRRAKVADKHRPLLRPGLILDEEPLAHADPDQESVPLS